MNFKDEWRLLAISDNMDDVEHRPMTEEYLFYQAVATGDVEAVRKNCEQERFVSEDGVGTLSRNPVTNLKYHFVITTAMITRMCGQNGMELEQAFRLSDFYIQKLDDIHTVQEVQNLHDEMVIDYTERMRREIQKDVISKHVSDCKDYIYCHIKERITVEQLANEFGISASYLSRLFKKKSAFLSATMSKIKRQKLRKIC
ncbi:Transcriptional regulator, AraC family [Streptococcus sp. HSISB1]|nr:Transcriptional regulator, AraC family [Streptococcus sp. HSISB1]